MGSRGWRWLDDRLGISSAIMPIVEHPVPPNLNWWYVLGSATLIAFVVQVVTGVALAFSYVPAPNSAYESLEFITNEAILGNVVRGIHYWGSSAMVVLIGAPRGARLPDRRLQVPARGELADRRDPAGADPGDGLHRPATALEPGRLLGGRRSAPRRPRACRSSATCWSSILIAGQTVGGATLTRFYATHVFLIPAVMFVLVGVAPLPGDPPRRLRAARAGPAGRPGDVPPAVRGAPAHRRHAVLAGRAWKDVVFALVVGAVVLLLAIGLGPPELGDRRPTRPSSRPTPGRTGTSSGTSRCWRYAAAERRETVHHRLPAALGIALMLRCRSSPRPASAARGGDPGRSAVVVLRGRVDRAPDLATGSARPGRRCSPRPRSRRA